MNRFIEVPSITEWISHLIFTFYGVSVLLACIFLVIDDCLVQILSRRVCLQGYTLRSWLGVRPEASCSVDIAAGDGDRHGFPLTS